MKKMKQTKSILYVQTSDQPDRQYSPLVLAQTAQMMDIIPQVYYLGRGLNILMPNTAKNIKIGSFPTILEMIQKTQEMDIKIYACEASKQMLGIDKIQLLPGVKIVGAGTLNDLVLDADATMWF